MDAGGGRGFHLGGGLADPEGTPAGSPRRDARRLATGRYRSRCQPRGRSSTASVEFFTA
jgi:hypothetical protein